MGSSKTPASQRSTLESLVNGFSERMRKADTGTRFGALLDGFSLHAHPPLHPRPKRLTQQHTGSDETNQAR
jgi:hypothetical protein